MNWKQKHANESDKVLNHALVVGVIDELMDNLANNCGVRPGDALVRYGLTKVAMYAAQVARAQALGFDPDLLRTTESESNAHMFRIARMAVESGKPVVFITGPTTVKP